MEGKIVLLISTNVFCLFRFFKVVKITANLGEPKQQFFDNRSSNYIINNSN